MSRVGFIDWMKTWGMLLIVAGHIVGDPFALFNQATQPIYTKQLGVTLFIFVMGWSLVNDSRPAFRVVYNRLFPIYFYGLACALLLSLYFWFSIGDLAESNYLPFMGGLNVFLNYFPANTTTWYIGTYVHLLLLWCFIFRGKKIGWAHLFLGFVVENICRTLLLWKNVDFIAYMTLPNWLSVFLLGQYLSKKIDLVDNRSLWVLMGVWGTLWWAYRYGYYIAPVGVEFPFRSVLFSAGAIGELVDKTVLSLWVSFTYIINTLLFFQIARRLPGLAIVRFFSRNTLIIFLFHMFIIFEFHQVYYDWLDRPWLNRPSLIFLVFVGLALLSEGIQRYVPLKKIKDMAWPLAAKFLAFVLPSRAFKKYVLTP